MTTVKQLYKPKQVDTFKVRGNDNNNLYKSRRWREVRAGYLRDNPFCVECKKEDKPLHQSVATVVDHITPINQGGDPWRRSNLQALCSRHHNIKSAREAHHTRGGSI